MSTVSGYLAGYHSAWNSLASGTDSSSVDENKQNEIQSQSIEGINVHGSNSQIEIHQGQSQAQDSSF